MKHDAQSNQNNLSFDDCHIAIAHQFDDFEVLLGIQMSLNSCSITFVNFSSQVMLSPPKLVLNFLLLSNFNETFFVGVA